MAICRGRSLIGYIKHGTIYYQFNQLCVFVESVLNKFFFVVEVLTADFDVLLGEMRRYLGSVLAETTKKTYMCHLGSYLRYCSYFNRIPVPADQATMLGYAVFLARSLNPRSIVCYLNIVRIIHLCAGLPNPLANNWELNLIKWGINRVHG